MFGNTAKLTTKGTYSISGKTRRSVHVVHPRVTVVTEGNSKTKREGVEQQIMQDGFLGMKDTPLRK